jgi:hypothetical protein
LDNAVDETGGTTAITSEGETTRSNTAVSTEADKPGTAPGGRSGGERPAPKELESVVWLVYDDTTHGFSISYPSVYVIVPSVVPAELQPLPISEVLFQAEDIAKSDVAALAPPVFTVRAFDNIAGLSSSDWLTTNQLLGAESFQNVEEITVSGVQGVKTCLAQAIVPNCFIYVTHGDHIFQLIPNGTYADEMLDSFQFHK